MKFRFALTALCLLYPTAMFGAMLGSSVTLLRLICVDNGLDASCTSKPETRSLAEFNRIYSLASVMGMFATNSVLAALADKWGRKAIITIVLCGLMFGESMWMLTTRSDTGFFRENWRIILPITVFLQSAAGSVAVAFFCIFTLAADWTRFRPQMRGSVFAIIEGCIGASGVLGSQAAGLFLSTIGPFYVFMFSFCCALLGLIIVTLFLDDTTPPEIKARKVDWSRANIFGALLILCPTRRTRALRDEDAHQSYEELCQELLRSHVGDAITVDPALVADNTAGIAATDDTEGVYVAPRPCDLDTPRPDEGADGNSADGTGLLDAELGGLASDGNGNNGDDTAGPLNRRKARHGAKGKKGFDPALTEGLAAADSLSALTIVASPASAHSSALTAAPDSDPMSPLQAASPSAVALYAQGVVLPAEPQRPGNALLVMACVGFLAMSAMLGGNGCRTAYLKQVYSISDRGVSTIATIEATARCLGTFLFVPVLHKYISSRLAELRTVRGMLLLKGLALMVYLFADELWQIYIILAFAGFFASIPFGFIKGIVSTEVGVLLQGKVLAAMAAVDMITTFVASMSFSSLFAETNDTFPEAVFVLAGALNILGAIVPVFISDSKAAFNSRRRRAKGPAPPGAAPAAAVTVLPGPVQTDDARGDKAFAAALTSGDTASSSSTFSQQQGMGARTDSVLVVPLPLPVPVADGAKSGRLN